MEIWLVILFLSRKKFHAKQIFVPTGFMKLGPDNVFFICYQYCSIARDHTQVYETTWEGAGERPPKMDVTSYFKGAGHHR